MSTRKSKNHSQMDDALNLEISTHIFLLNYDCFEQMFMWLSLKDLLKIRLTCKKLKEYADIYIRATYPKFTFGYGRVTINDYTLVKLQHLEPHLVKLIKEIRLSTVWILNAQDIKSLKAILGQIETGV